MQETGLSIEEHIMGIVIYGIPYFKDLKFIWVNQGLAT